MISKSMQADPSVIYNLLSASGTDHDGTLLYLSFFSRTVRKVIWRSRRIIQRCNIQVLAGNAQFSLNVCRLRTFFVASSNPAARKAHTTRVSTFGQLVAPIPCMSRCVSWWILIGLMYAILSDFWDALKRMWLFVPCFQSRRNNRRRMLQAPKRQWSHW